MKKLIGHGDWPSAKSLFSALIPGLFALGTLPLAAAETQTTQRSTAWRSNVLLFNRQPMASICIASIREALWMMV